MGANGRSSVGDAAKAGQRWLGFNAPNPCPDPHPGSACSCAGRCWPGHALRSSWKSPDQPQTLRFESSLATGGSSSESRAGDLQVRHSWPAGQRRQMAIQNNERCLSAPLTSKRCRRCRGGAKVQGAREVMRPTRSENRAPRPTAWDSHARRARQGSRAEAASATPRHSPERQLEATLKSRRRRGRRRRGSTLALQQLPAGAPPVEMWLIFLATPHLLDGRHGVTPPMIVQQPRARSRPRRGCGPHRWWPAVEFVETRTRPSAVPDHGFSVGQGLLEGLE